MPEKDNASRAETGGAQDSHPVSDIPENSEFSDYTFPELKIKISSEMMRKLQDYATLPNAPEYTDEQIARMENILLQSRTANAEKQGIRLWPVDNFLDYPDKDIEHGEMIIESPQGIVLAEKEIWQITGSGKEGKSLFVKNLAIGLATGRSMYGLQITKPHKVLYLNGENSPRTMQMRFRLMRDFYAVDEQTARLMKRNFVFTDVRFSLTTSLNEIVFNLEYIKPDILIIDPMKNYYSGNEDKAEHMRLFFDSLRDLIEQFNFSAIIVHHTGKNVNQQVIYSGRGSSLSGDDTNTTSYFQKVERKNNRFIVKFIGRNFEDFEINLIRPADHWYLYQLADQVEPDQIPGIHELIDELGDDFFTADFITAAKKIGIAERTAYKYLNDAVQLHLLQKVTKGKYSKKVLHNENP